MDRLDLGLRWQLLALETVDSEHRLGPTEFLDLTLEFRRDRPRGVDLLLGHVVAKLTRAAVAGHFLQVASDRHRLFELAQRQDDDCLLSPVRIRTSRTSPASNPGNSARTL